jgi:hypothetical protein
MEYYSSALHEMAHSTGTESRLNRVKGDRFGDPKYAKEELVAELTAANTGYALGFDKRILDNNAAYLDGWISVLKENPKFIVSVMADVNKASNMVLEAVDKQRTRYLAAYDSFEKYFPGKVFQTKIPRNVRLSEAPSHGKPIHYYDRTSKGAEAYEMVCHEMLGEPLEPDIKPRGFIFRRR